MGNWRPDFKINGISVPIPDNYSQVISDLSSEETGRTLDGKMHKDVIAVKTTTPLEWTDLEWKEAAIITNAVDGKSEISCEFMDIRKPYQMSKGTIYVGDRTCDISYFDTDGKVYWNLLFSEIEV